MSYSNRKGKRVVNCKNPQVYVYYLKPVNRVEIRQPRT
jgi:hypothetical protein